MCNSFFSYLHLNYLLISNNSSQLFFFFEIVIGIQRWCHNTDCVNRLLLAQSFTIPLNCRFSMCELNNFLIHARETWAVRNSEVKPRPRFLTKNKNKIHTIYRGDWGQL